ncbi:MAG TPA: PHP domain-containing protein [Planctomycetota bacterium]|nr:PHP domain-containing protein [Planctomycetota bacterium]
MPDRCIDLHCHSTASDGRLTPAQLVERAKQRNLRALALTDHDTVAGLGMFHQAGKKFGVETISGVEVSAEFAKGTMHMLGLFVDPQHQAFRAFLKKLAEGRKIRNPQIVAKLNELGMAITMEEVEAEAGVKDNGPGGGAIDKSIGRPHIAAVLIKKGYVRTKQEAFDKYLAKGASAYFPRFVASPQDSIEQIRSAGGLAILAHPPYLKAESDAELDAIIKDLKDKGLDGIEVWYSTHTPQQTEVCFALAKKYELLATGGSDFHGEPARGGGIVDLGLGVNGPLNIAYSTVEKLKERRASRK